MNNEPFDDSDQRFMQIALDEAIKAYDQGEVPVGAVVVHQGRIVGRGHNLRETLHDPTAHAEVIALTAASEALKSWRLEDCTMYVTLEPCPMCAGALVNARVPRVVYGATDPKAGACESLYHLLQDDRLNHCAEVLGGIMAEDSALLLRQFFQEAREKSRRKRDKE